MVSTYYAIDDAAGLVKRDIGQAAITADAYIGTQWDQGAAAATNCILVGHIEALDIGNDDEYCTFTVTGSNATNRSDAVVLGSITIGAADAINLETVDSAVGDRFEMRFRTEKNGAKFRYIDLHADVGGTGPTFTFNAYISKEFG